MGEKWSDVLAAAPDVHAMLLKKLDEDDAWMAEDMRIKARKSFTNALAALKIDAKDVEETIQNDGSDGYVVLEDGARLYLFRLVTGNREIVGVKVRREFPAELAGQYMTWYGTDPQLVMPSVAPESPYNTVTTIAELQSCIVENLAWTKEDLERRVKQVEKELHELKLPLRVEDLEVIEIMERTAEGIKQRRMLLCDERAMRGFAMAVVNLYDGE